MAALLSRAFVIHSYLWKMLPNTSDVPLHWGQSLTGEGPECRMFLNWAEDDSVLE